MTGNKYCQFENTQKSQADETKQAMSEICFICNTKDHQSFPSSLRCTSIEEVLSLLYSGAYFLLKCLNIDERSSCIIDLYFKSCVYGDKFPKPT